MGGGAGAVRGAEVQTCVRPTRCLPWRSRPLWDIGNKGINNYVPGQVGIMNMEQIKPGELDRKHQGRELTNLGKVSLRR